MTPYEMELEVLAYQEFEAIREGRQTPRPTSESIERVRNFVPYTGELKRKDGQLITPKELGWE